MSSAMEYAVIAIVAAIMSTDSLGWRGELLHLIAGFCLLRMLWLGRPRPTKERRRDV